MNNDYTKVRKIIREAIMEVVQEKNDMNQYVPKKCFKVVDKLNAAMKELQKLTGDEHPSLLDLSSGTEFFFDMLTDVRIENGKLKWTQLDNEYWKKNQAPHEEEWNLIRYDEDEGYWFDEYEFKDTISFLNKCIKRAAKYFSEYNPETMDDNDTEHDKFLGSL